MAKLEHITPETSIKGVLPEGLVTVINVKWIGTVAIELTYKDAEGNLGSELVYRDREPTLEIVTTGQPWSFDGNGALFRLVSEARRIHLAYLFDPLLAVHTSLVEPLPHQLTAVYEQMLPRQPLRFLLADDPGAGKTIMTGLLIKELLVRGDLQRCLIVCPGNLAEQWQDELDRRFHLPFEIMTNDALNRYEIKNVPAAIRNRDRQIGRSEPVLPTTSILQTSCPPSSTQKFSNQPLHFLDPRKSPFVRPSSRGELPHLEKPGGTYFVTFRLADAVKMGKQKNKDLSEKAGRMPAPQGQTDSPELAPEEIARGCETPLTLGSCALGRDDVAAMVQDALLHFHNQHYQLHAWCIMPNHVHVVVTPLDGHELSAILHSWKSYTSKQAGKLLGSTGTFWQRESFDHLCRSRQHVQWFVRYAEENPVKAGLCVAPQDWKFSSAGHAAGNPDSGDDSGKNCGAAVPAAVTDQQAGCLHHKTDNQEQADNLSLDQGGTGPQAYADAVATYLAFGVDKCTDYWCTVATWSSSAEFIRGSFARQALPMTWDYCECNPLSRSTANWSAAVDWTALATLQLPAAAPARAAQQSAAAERTVPQKVLISTDPPYYDNIGYADLSDFFYVWLRRSLGDIYPELFKTLLTPKSEELIATPYRHGGDKLKAQKFFESGLGQAFHRMREVQPAEYPMTVFYAFKQSEDAGGEEPGSGQDGSDEEIAAGGTPAPQTAAQVSTGWETMLAGLIDSGFAVTGTWPMRTERGARSIGIGTNALASSIVLSCRPRSADAPVATRREFLAALKHELPDALRYLQEGNIAPVDLAQASIGPGMAIFTRYAKVMEADGSSMSVRTALGIINQMLDEVLAEQEGEFDPDTRWAVAWFEQFGLEDGPFGEAETLSRAKNNRADQAAVLRNAGAKFTGLA